MVGKLLVRGMLAGIAAGLLSFGFAKIVGEPQVDQAISFEAKANAAKGEAPEPELVSRHTQAGLGLLTGVMAYSAAIGGLFALTFAAMVGRGGKVSANVLSVWLAIAGFVALVIVPNLKYPANPPSVGDPETIGYRTGLYFLMILISLCALIFAVGTGRRLVERLGGFKATLAGARKAFGRRLVVAGSGGGGEIRLRVSNDTNIEGIADRSQFKAGMKVTAQYIEPQGGNPALGYNVMDIDVER